MSLNNLHRYIISIFLIVMASLTMTIKAQRLAVKTDPVRWGLMMPNVGAELSIGDRWSMDLSVSGTQKPYWSHDAKLFTLQPELRYWLSGRQMSRFYVGATALWSRYDMKYESQMHEGDLYGGGITFGYSWFLSTRWSLEAYGGFGIFGYKEKRYRPTDDVVDIPGVFQDFYNTSGYKMLPARIGVSFSYIIR